MNYKLSPSDFAFLWEDCKRCFYLKVARNYPQPRSIMATIFTIIDNEMKNCFSGKRLNEIISGFPPGIVQYGERWVESIPIAIDGETDKVFLRGKFDTIVKFDDDTYGVIDFKTSQRKSEHMPFYSRQLHAYAHALEHPAPGKFAVRPVSRLGLLVYEPHTFLADGMDKASLKGGLTWIEIPRDESKFLAFLKGVLTVLKQPDLPPSNPECQYCRYRESGKVMAI